VTDIAIQVADLSKKFSLHLERRDSLKERFVRGRGKTDDFWALRDVSFDVERGTTFALIGHNGSGKSTLLKMLAGIYRPTSGSIVANGRVSALLELGAGFHGELTGRENVYLNGAILGMSRKQIDASMDRIIDFAGIGEFIDSPVKIYSSGMYVRLGFSIAITADPEILVVDEIIAVGDEEFQRKCFDYLFELRRLGTTIVIVSHSLPIVTDLCDQGVWLDRGHMRSVGDIRDVVDAYLHDVNLREAASETGEVGTDESTRRGSGEIQIDRIEYLDESGEVRPLLKAGEPCSVRLHYHSNSYLKDIVFGIGFFSESGVNVAGPNSGYGERAFTVAAGRGFVDFSVDTLPLQPGAYLVSTAVVDRGHTFDHLDRAFQLRVRADNATTEPGLVRLPGSWQLHPDGNGEKSSKEPR
jgi:lipopolysaccharide transport system ATP-binding protein